MPFMEEVRDRLVAAAGFTAASVHWSPASSVPAGDGPFTQLNHSGGTAGWKVQDVPGVAYENPACQVVSIAATPTLARARAKAAYDALVTVRNQTLSGTWYMVIDADQSPFDFPVDGLNRPRCVFNIRATKQPS